MSELHQAIPTPPPLVLLSSADDFWDEQADLLSALFPAPTVIEPVPHVHQWFVGCRKDMHGTTVFDCSCGARKRTKGSVDGEEIIIEPPGSVMGDVLFDYSQINDQGQPRPLD